MGAIPTSHVGKCSRYGGRHDSPGNGSLCETPGRIFACAAARASATRMHTTASAMSRRLVSRTYQSAGLGRRPAGRRRRLAGTTVCWARVRSFDAICGVRPRRTDAKNSPSILRYVRDVLLSTYCRAAGSCTGCESEFSGGGDRWQPERTGEERRLLPCWCGSAGARRESWCMPEARAGGFWWRMDGQGRYAWSLFWCACRRCG